MGATGPKHCRPPAAIQKPRLKGIAGDASDGRRKYAFVRVHFKKGTSLKRVPLSQTNLRLKVLLDTQVSDLPEKFRALCQRHFLFEAPLGRKLSKATNILSISCRAHPPGPSWGGIDLHSRIRVETVADLLEDLANIREEILFEVSLDLGKSKSKIPKLEDRVLFPVMKHSFSCIRIGNVPIDDPAARGSDLKDSRIGPRELGAEYSWPLLVWIDRSKKELRFSRTHAYEFDEFCVGDIYETNSWNRLKFSNKYRYFGKFANILWKGEDFTKFMTRLKDHLDEGGWSHGSGLPILPAYCFNTYTPQDLGLGVDKWPKRGVDVAVRCVNHYQTEELHALSFPRDIRLVIMEEDSMAEIHEFIDDELNVQETRDNLLVNSKLLYKEPHVGKWEMDLWVMPQRTRKLFRFTEGQLIQFLDPSSKTRTMDKSLYMEVHIVQK